MKKILAAALAVIIILTPLAGCKKRKTPVSSEQSETTDTLWDKSVSYVKTELPPDALESDDSVAQAISPDGSRLFISAPYGTVPYLWDIDEEKKIPLSIGNEITADAFRFLFWNMAMINIKDSDAMDKFREENADVDTLKGDKLLERIYSTGDGPFLTAAGYTVPVKDNVMIVSDRSYGMPFALDANTGAIYSVPEGNIIGEIGGTIYALAKPKTIFKYEMATGKELERLDFSFAMENGVASNAFVLADGTLCAVVYDFSGDIQTGVECALGVLRPDGRQEVFSLGKRSMSQMPANLFTADGKYFVLQNSISSDFATLVDTVNGEISLLVPKGSALEKVPLDSRLDEGGTVNALTDDNKFYRFYMGMSDGETLLCADKDSEPALFRPSTVEVKKILPGVVMPVFTSYSGNGYDRWLFFDSINFKNVWIRFDVK